MTMDTHTLDLFDARNYRDAALDLLEDTRESYVERAREAAIALASDGRDITIDDVREVCPPPDDVDPRVMGTVLRAPLFVKVGYATSSRKTCHARPIAVFRLRGAAQ